MVGFHSNKGAATAAFTLRELVVVMAVLSLLGGTLIASMHRAALWRIKKAQCAANLRQFAQATQLYATDNQDRLPEITSGSWAWDFPGYTADAFLGFGMGKRTFYCPGTTPRFNDTYNFLNSAPNSLWNYWGNSSSGFRVIGYVAAFNGGTLSLTNQNRTILPEPPKLNSVTYLSTPPNHERVLLTDATISENQGGTAANPAPAGSFVNVPGGFLNGSIPHISPHLNGNLPAGGNLAFKDGHVDWHQFSKMSQRATGSSRGFWW